MGGLDPNTPPWATQYYEQQRQQRVKQTWGSRLRPAAISAYLAVFGRIVVMPMAIVILFSRTGYLSSGTFLIESKDSYFAYSQMDLVMSGGCTPCHISCQKALHQMATFNHDALMSKPTFEDLYTATSWDYSILPEAAFTLAESLEASGAICSGGIDEWGSPLTIITGEAQEVVDIINTLELSVAPQTLLEAMKGIETKDECVTKWAVEAHLRLFKFQAVANSVDYSSIPAADFNVFPEYTDCRPDVPNDGIVGEKLALATGGENLVAVVPDILKLFPYEFSSSLPEVSRTVVTTSPTIYNVASVRQSYFRGYYGGCRVRTVNTTGVYVEDTCTVAKRWETYGLMLQSPDDIPVCSVGNVCIHNYYNSLWEWVTGLDASVDRRALMLINVFRNRYADTVQLSVLPGMVVVQILLMGVISLYQVMSHKRSVLLTQIWAYRCQNGRMQVVYLAQITYHIIYNSDLYYMGLTTGTLTVESVANLTFSIFVFSYAFINLAKARSGEQQLDRYFRLTWETMQIVITTIVASVLFSARSSSLRFVVDINGELLRKTTERGAKYCGLNDSCFLMKWNLVFVISGFSTLLGLLALSASALAQRRYAHEATAPAVPFSAVGAHRFASTKVKAKNRHKTKYGVSEFNDIKTSRTDDSGELEDKSSVDEQCSANERTSSREKSGGDKRPGSKGKCEAKVESLPPLTSFEDHCLGSPFTRLFKDCDDFSTITYMGKRCTSVEALLLTGYLFYGQHIYQAPSVVMLLAARLLPRKLLRTFNVLLIRWWVDPEEGTTSYAQSCTWYTASAENYNLSEATPVA